MLRMVVLSDGRQRVLGSVPAYEVGETDLRGLSPGEVELRLGEIRQRMSHQVLEAESWPLFEVHACRLDSGRIRLHISTDALIHDAWSLAILRHDLFWYYVHPEANLPELMVSFRDYMLAEVALRDTEPFRRSWEYWQKRLPTLPTAPELPMARTPGSLERPRFARRSGGLAPERWERLKKRAAQAGLTPSGLIAAAFGEVLGAWSKSRGL